MPSFLHYQRSHDVTKIFPSLLVNSHEISIVVGRNSWYSRHPTSREPGARSGWNLLSHASKCLSPIAIAYHSCMEYLQLVQLWYATYMHQYGISLFLLTCYVPSNWGYSNCYIYIYVCMYVCIYIYICIYIYVIWNIPSCMEYTKLNKLIFIWATNHVAIPAVVKPFTLAIDSNSDHPDCLAVGRGYAKLCRCARTGHQTLDYTFHEYLSIPWRIRMYAIYGNIYHQQKPPVLFASIYHTYGSVMGLVFWAPWLSDHSDVSFAMRWAWPGSARACDFRPDVPRGWAVGS